MPVDDTKLFTIEHITTNEIKCGRYESVCTTLGNTLPLSSFIRSARTIGAGNAKSSVLILITSVFFKMRQKYGLVINS